MHRRDFVKNTAISTAGFAILPSGTLFNNASKVRLGIIGVGLRGQSHLTLALRRSDVEVVAICDVDQRMLGMASDVIKKSGKAVPKIFTGDAYSWRKLLELKDLDGVIIATPWEWHAPMSIEALEAGKYVGTEVVLGITLEDHWNVVKTCERTKGHLMMLENVCYRRDVMAILNMVRKNMFGEVLHLQGGYEHDLRGVLFTDKASRRSGVEFGEKGFSEAQWRTQHYVDR